MFKLIINFFKNLLNEPLSEDSKRDFCHWCHRTDCPHPDFESCKQDSFMCKDHPKENKNGPSFCHRCPQNYDLLNDKWIKPTTKPTIFLSDKNDPIWCHNWICEACDKADKNREADWNAQYQNTIEAAKLSFIDTGNGMFTMICHEPIEADFYLTYESLAPFTTRIWDIANEYYYHGVEFGAILIRDGKVGSREYDGPREYWNEDSKEDS